MLYLLDKWCIFKLIRRNYAHRHKVGESILLGINGNLSLWMGTPFCRIEKYARGHIQYEGAS